MYKIEYVDFSKNWYLEIIQFGTWILNLCDIANLNVNVFVNHLFLTAAAERNGVYRWDFTFQMVL